MPSSIENSRERQSCTKRAALSALVLVALLSTPARAADDWLGPDKALHFGAAAGLAAAGYTASAVVVKDEVVRLGSGAFLALAAGLAKEMRDRTSGGDPSLKDLTWDAIGAATGLVVSYVIERLVFRP
jgi:putative lipoprotein